MTDPTILDQIDAAYRQWQPVAEWAEIRVPAPLDASDVEFRPARPADLSGLLAVEADCFAYERLSARSFRRYLNLTETEVLVACHGGRVIGYALARRWRKPTCWRVISLAVATRTSGRGIGEQLLCRLHNRITARGGKSLCLEVRADNQAALALYRRLGYWTDSLMTAYYCDGQTAVRMRCDPSEAERPSGS